MSLFETANLFFKQCILRTVLVGTLAIETGWSSSMS